MFFLGEAGRRTGEQQDCNQQSMDSNHDEKPLCI
jgi:hypothetical protein